ncbi:hypothetical protein ZWY2020_003979 [Hordeum vulgare]|nr:hypothetical protein ZWY2020_003979 [Hordeum vulgare]
MPVLCNPFKPKHEPAPVRPRRGRLQHGVAGKELCTTVGRVTPAAYNQMTAAASISRGLYEYGPFLMQLQDCTFVRETFSSISVNNCPGLRH